MGLEILIVTSCILTGITMVIFTGFIALLLRFGTQGVQALWGRIFSGGKNKEKALPVAPAQAQRQIASSEALRMKAQNVDFVPQSNTNRPNAQTFTAQTTYQQPAPTGYAQPTQYQQPLQTTYQQPSQPTQYQQPLQTGYQAAQQPTAYQQPLQSNQYQQPLQGNTGYAQAPQFNAQNLPTQPQVPSLRPRSPLQATNPYNTQVPPQPNPLAPTQGYPQQQPLQQRPPQAPSLSPSRTYQGDPLRPQAAPPPPPAGGLEPYRPQLTARPHSSPDSDFSAQAPQGLRRRDNRRSDDYEIIDDEGGNNPLGGIGDLIGL